MEMLINNKCFYKITEKIAGAEQQRENNETREREREKVRVYNKIHHSHAFISTRNGHLYQSVSFVCVFVLFCLTLNLKINVLQEQWKKNQKNHERRMTA